MQTHWTVVRYQLRNARLPLIILCAVLLGVVLLSVVLSLLIPGDGVITFTSIELSMVINLGICGALNMREAFGFCLQNGATRRSVYAGTVMAAVVISASYAAVAGVIFALAEVAEGIADNLRWETLTSLVYAPRYGADGLLRMHTENLAINFTLDLLAYVVGSFFSIAYYRMNRLLKYLISIGIPMILVVLLPVIDLAVWNGRNLARLGEIFARCMGLAACNPWYAFCSLICAAALAAAFTWPLLRRAVVR